MENLDNIKVGQEVLVTNTDNYKASYSEEIPFKAVVIDFCLTSDICLWVKSLVTGKKYELYVWQIEETNGNTK